MEARMFDNSIRRDVKPSFLYLVMAATYFRQARSTHQSKMREALRKVGREYVINARRVVHACPSRGLHPLIFNSQP
jgi:hypothetical protein